MISLCARCPIMGGKLSKPSGKEMRVRYTLTLRLHSTCAKCTIMGSTSIRLPLWSWNDWLTAPATRRTSMERLSTTTLSARTTIRYQLSSTAMRDWEGHTGQCRWRQWFTRTHNLRRTESSSTNRWRFQIGGRRTSGTSALCCRRWTRALLGNSCRT